MHISISQAPVGQPIRTEHQAMHPALAAKGTVQSTARADVDAAVLQVMETLPQPSDAAAIARLSGASIMAVAYALRRLEAAGHVDRHVEIIDTPGRYGTTVLLWRRAAMPTEQPWPAWLAPCALPRADGSIRIRRW
jgi:hypothetical protein